MAYSSGVFYIDLVSGSDAARTALTTCTAANPSGTITRITKAGHGLVTGAVVDLTLFTTWLNSAWKITVVDANNFDLDGAVWQATADNNGTVTPRGGSSWADAWLTINTGATAARIQPGDTFRIAKTADPVSLGQNATFTDGSSTVTLTSAVTKKIEDASSAIPWVASANITVGSNTIRKIGATAVTITPATAFTTGKAAYCPIAGGGSQDFSGYRYLNLWIRPTTAVAVAANTWRIALCTDTIGDVIINAFSIPAMSANIGWNCFVLDLGSAMSGVVQSVAVYALSDPGTTAISINNMFASNGNISLKTLIGKSGDVNYNIQSIDGTTIKIDSNNNALGGKGYSGTTSTETLYYQVPFDTAVTASWATMNEAGDTLNDPNKYSFGWNTSSNTRDGYTLIANTLVGAGTAITPVAYSTIEYLKMARYSVGVAGNPSWVNVDNCIFSGLANPISSTSSSMLISNTKFLNSSSGLSVAGYTAIFKNCEFRNSTVTGLNAYAGNKLLNCTFANNTTSSISVFNGDIYSESRITLRNCVLSDTTEVSYTASVFAMLWSFDHDNTQGNHWGFTDGGTINWQTTTKQGSDPGSWKVTHTSSLRPYRQAIWVKLAEVLCAASSLVTVKVWVKKDHATNVEASIYIDDSSYNIDGVTTTEVTKTDDTNWEQLTLTFTPTEAGVVPIWGKSWYVAGTSNTYFGSTLVTQA